MAFSLCLWGALHKDSVLSGVASETLEGGTVVSGAYKVKGLCLTLQLAQSMPQIQLQSFQQILKKQKPTYNLSTWEAGWEGQKFKAIWGTLSQKTKEKKRKTGE